MSESESAHDKDFHSSTEPPQSPTPTHNHTPTLQSIEAAVEVGSDEQFQAILWALSVALSTHGHLRLFQSKLLHYRLMKCLHRWHKQMQAEPEREERVLFVMSLLAELARRDPKVRLPFTRKIAQALLSFDPAALRSPHGCHITRILAVLLANLAAQGRAAAKLDVASELKNGLLLLTCRVDELSTLRILLRAIHQLAPHAPVTPEDLTRTQALSGLREHFGEEAAAKARTLLCHTGCKKQTLLELISQ